MQCFSYLRQVGPALVLASPLLLAVCCAAGVAQNATKTDNSRPHKKASALPKSAKAVPLSSRERVAQLLNRFSYGPRPGEIDHVLAEGADVWLEKQLHPSSIDDSALNRRLSQLPTLAMTPAQALAVFPDRPQVAQVAQNKAPYPSDPMQKAVMEVQVARWQAEQDRKSSEGDATLPPVPSEAEKVAKRQADQSRASELFGQIYQLPSAQRMAAVIALPVQDRIALTGSGHLRGDQRNQLLAEFNPRERETFEAMSGNVNSSGNIADELAQGRILRDILSERQLEAVMTDFWFNHFNVFIGKDSDQWYTTSYERDVIRRHALGSFKDLLLATAQSPAMLVYLDNWLSTGPDSVANGVVPRTPKSKKGSRGLNENYGREVMELHTVGVDGGYTQADVTSLAAILTGWTVDRPQDGGGFLYDARRHEPGAKAWFGYRIAEDGSVTKLEVGLPVVMPTETSSETPDSKSMRQGMAALTLLATSPKTAHFISWKLAQYFVADDPPPALVERLSAVFLVTGGDIPSLLRALVHSPEFNSRLYFHNKVKTPVEFLASTMRASATDPTNPRALVNTCQQMGMPFYRALPPTGYYLTADHWMNSTALVDRLNFAYQLTAGKYANQRFDAPQLLAIGMMTPMAVKMDTQPARLATLSSAGLPGPDTAIQLLEATLISTPVTPRTDELIRAQRSKQPVSASTGDTLNLLTALVLGSPDFQLR